MNLGDTDYLQAPRIEALKRQIASAKDESEKQRFLKALVQEIVKAVNAISLQSFDKEVNVNNFDEVTASLRNELSKANKPIADLLKSLKLTTEEQTKVMKDLETKSQKSFSDQFETAIVRRVKDVVSVDNLSDIPIVDKITVTNLKDIEKYFKGLEAVIQTALNINLPAPQVSVSAPIVNVPETQFNIPPVDLVPLLESLYSITESLKKLKTNDKSHPLAVRLTDGGDWIRDLIKVQKETSKAVAAFAGGANMVRLLDPNMNVVNPSALSVPSTIGDGLKSVTTAGTRVQLSANTPCRYVIITANSTNTNNIYVGGTTVDSTRGRPLVSLQSEKFDIDNLNKIYLDADTNGEGVVYAYVN